MPHAPVTLRLVPVLAGMALLASCTGGGDAPPTRSAAASTPAASAPPVTGFATPAEIAAAIPDEQAVTLSPAGHYEVGGKPRFLVGAQFLPAYIAGAKRPTTGYTADQRWLYEQPLGHDGARRLGLDTLGYFVGDDWLKAFPPGKPNDFLHGQVEREGFDRLLSGARLPVYVDTTCFPWTHGGLEGQGRGGKYPAAAFNVGGSHGNTNHWMPYSATTDEGRALWLALWRHGAEEMRRRTLRPLVYELLNEPAYDDPSPANRERFAARLRTRYGDVAALNRAWGSSYADVAAAAAFQRPNENPGLQAEWGMFLEDAIVELVRAGRAAVQAVAPGTPCAVQVLGMDRYRAVCMTNVNLARLAEHLEVIGSGTGAGMGIGQGLAAPAATAIATPDCDSRISEGFIHHRFLRAVAGNKPIYDGESYAGTGVRDADQLAVNLWLELARGISATYLFGLERRTWDTLWKDGAEAGGRRLAEKFPWDLLNPYATAPESLTGIMAFQRAKAPLEALLVPRAHRLPGQVALLVSLPSERLAPAVPGATHQQVRTYAAALEFAHQAWEVVLDQQLAERAGRYRAVVAAGARYGEPGTPAALRRYAEAGGTVILGLETLDCDHLGQPLPAGERLGPPLGETLTAPVGALTGALAAPAWLPGELRGQPWRATGDLPGWTVLASAGAQPAVVERQIGRGRICFVNLRAPAYTLAAVLGTLLERAGVERQCDLRREPGGGLLANVEAHRFRDGTLTGTVLINHDSHPKLASLDAAGAGAVADALGRRVLPLADGRATLVLPARGVAVVVAGARAAIDGLGLGAAAVGREALAAEVASWRAPATARSAGLGPDYPEGQSFQVIELRAHHNRAFIDSLAGDGKGGWTDQGAVNSLEGTPWGRQDLLGVPFEFIRTDENADRTCLVMQSPNQPTGAQKVEGIAVGTAVEALYFLQAAAWCEVPAGTEVMRYVVRYADGGAVTVPVRVGHEVADWWNPAPQVGEARRAWRNGDNRSLWAWRWANPEPARVVASFDVVSAGKAPIGILVAATAALPRAAALPLPAGWKPTPWLGATATLAGGVLCLAPGEPAQDWCGVALVGEPLAAPAGGWPAAPRLVCEVDGGSDRWGAHQGGQNLQVGLVLQGADGKRHDTGYVPVRVAGGIDADPTTWQRASADLGAIPAGAAVVGVRLQFVGSAPAGGVAVRALAIEGR